jgi:sugar-specific transcriptional regulator TrmB
MQHAGLTVNQAKVYLNLIQIGKETVKNIAQNARMDRANVYRTVKELQKKGLVRKIIDIPSKWEAISANDGLTMLLKRQENSFLKLKKEITFLIDDMKTQETKAIEESEGSFVLIPPREGTKHFLAKKIGSTQTSFSFLVNFQIFKNVINDLLQELTKALKRGVEVRIVLWNKEPGIDLKLNSAFDNKSNFKVRYITDIPPITSSIFDNKETFISTSLSGDPVESPGLWSNTSSFVQLIQNNFDLYWKTAIQHNKE